MGPTPPRSVAQGISFLHSFFEPDIFSVIKIGKNLKSSFWSRQPSNPARSDGSQVMRTMGNRWKTLRIGIQNTREVSECDSIVSKQPPKAGVLAMGTKNDVCEISGRDFDDLSSKKRQHGWTGWFGAVS